MTGLARTFGAAAATAAITALLAGVALADNPHNPGPGTPPGNSGTPPGQAKKDPAGQGQGTTSNGKAKGKLEASTRAHPAHPAHPVTPARGAPAGGLPVATPSTQGSSNQPAFAAAKGQGHEKTAHHKVIICHRTGSATNPYVAINVSINAWQNGHSKHPALDGRSDILLQDPAAPGDKPDPALVAARCGAGAVAPAALKTAAPAARSAGVMAAAGVLGVSKTLSRPAKKPARSAGGVLGVMSAPVVRGQLPFTGLPLWSSVLAAAALLAGGLALRRRVRAT